MGEVMRVPQSTWRSQRPTVGNLFSPSIMDARDST